LSEQEIIDILGWPTRPDYELHQATAAGQLATTDKEWVAWVNEVFWFDHDRQTMGLHISGDRLYKLYQARRKEIGL